VVDLRPIVDTNLGKNISKLSTTRGTSVSYQTVATPYAWLVRTTCLRQHTRSAGHTHTRRLLS
jgi:hypothetical protein